MLLHDPDVVVLVLLPPVRQGFGSPEQSRPAVQEIFDINALQSASDMYWQNSLPGDP